MYLTHTNTFTYTNTCIVTEKLYELYVSYMTLSLGISVMGAWLNEASSLS